MSAPSLQPGPTYSQLLAQLQKKPAHVATSFELKEARGMGKQRFSLKSPLHVPQTGIQPVDSFIGKTNSLFDLTTSTVVDVPKAAIKGGIYGTVGGGLAGLVAWPVLRLSKTWAAGTIIGLALAGGLMGSVMNTAREVLAKVRQLFGVIF